MAKKLSELLNGVNLNSADSNQLASALNTQQTAQRTDDQLRAEAERAVGSLYNQKSLAAQQSYDRTANSLRNQLDSLSATYDRQREQAAANTRQTASAVDRQMMGRGMGRSSYGLATIGNVYNEGDKLQDNINTNQANQASGINSQLALAEQQLGDILSAYTTDKETDILARMDELRSRDQADARATTEYNNNLILALADRLRQQQEIEFNQGMATKQFDAGRADAAFDQGMAREQMDFNMAQALFQQQMAEKGFDADRADAAFQQALSRDQFNLNVDNSQFDQRMTQAEFDARYGQPTATRSGSSTTGGTLPPGERTSAQPPSGTAPAANDRRTVTDPNKAKVSLTTTQRTASGDGRRIDRAPDQTTQSRVSPIRYTDPYGRQGGSSLLRRLNNVMA